MEKKSDETARLHRFIDNLDVIKHRERINQSKLAERLGISLAYLSQVINGHKQLSDSLINKVELMADAGSNNGTRNDIDWGHRLTTTLERLTQQFDRQLETFTEIISNAERDKSDLRNDKKWLQSLIDDKLK